MTVSLINYSNPTGVVNRLTGPSISVVLLALSAQGQKYLKLYCRYEYTNPCMINRIWGLKQLWLQVNGNAWFHLQLLRWTVGNWEGAKNSKWKYMYPAGLVPTLRQSTTGKSAPKTARPRGLDGDKWFTVLQDNGIQFFLNCYVTIRVILIMVTCAFELNDRAV